MNGAFNRLNQNAWPTRQLIVRSLSGDRNRLRSIMRLGFHRSSPYLRP
jgi:hypothetical protein